MQATFAVKPFVMQLIVLANEQQKIELAKTLLPAANVVWIEEEEAFLQHKNADAFLDLEFLNTDGRKAVLQQLLPRPVIVNSVVETLAAIHPSFVRINAWEPFLSSPLIEAACAEESCKAAVADAFAVFGKTPEWLPDEPGFVTARVVSTIVNEAFLAMGEGVSTKDQIDTAMKLGTAYPFGPFEWAEKIGLQNIVTLLQTLAETHPRYAPAELMVQETNKAI